jgi:hypothetical protein
MIQSIRAAIKSLMTKAANAGLSEQLTILQGIDSNDQQIQDIVSKQPLYVYKANISQVGISAPTANVLINTFPVAQWAYLGIGSYSVELGVDLGAMKITKIQQTCFNGTIAFNVNGYDVSTFYQIDTYDATRTLADEILANYTLVIEAYPA